ncbi:FtsB family cell division protein [Secundilactobacillus folii]|uniref:Septum formation initiator family protein n=1 Tax=Secundilactobacillus folii TaxID=2678357 RepID=A0A7X2XZR6_9LACO|nr:septum formation initiator family protein [Secundilactobacillus folii]MTV83316.1 septum formation initiator family protein [Secundilactobacillus folii]
MAKQSNITQLDNHYTRQVQQHSNKAVLTKRRKKRALLMALPFLLVMLVLGYQIVEAKVAMNRTNVQIARQQQKLTKVKNTHKQLDEHVKLLNDKGYLENLIRSKYYFSKSGETIYSLPNDKAADVTAK